MGSLQGGGQGLHERFLEHGGGTALDYTYTVAAEAGNVIDQPRNAARVLTRMVGTALAGSELAE